MPVKSPVVWNSVLNVPQSNVRVGNCYGGIPIVMTAPHFHNADPGLLDQVIGVSPDIEKHDTVLDIEPITGVALSAHKRIQVPKYIYHLKILY